MYEIPLFANANPVLKTVLGHWQANGIKTLRSGLPFNVSTGADTANTASSGVYRPNLVKAPAANCGRGHLVACIDPTAFTVNDFYLIAPANFAYGKAGRNLLFGPSAQDVNFSVAKNFPITERIRFQFRFETFGLFNHNNFGNPSATIDTGAFGNLTGASGERNIQLGGKLVF